MAEAARNDVLDRKITAGRRVQDAQTMSPAKALRRALARAGDELWSLAVLASGVEERRLDQEDAIDALPTPEQMIVMLDGPQGELGLALVERQVVKALVEIQTISCVTQTDPGDRAFSQTDAAMVQPYLEDVLARFAANLGDNPVAQAVEGYRFGAMVADRRIVANQMAAPNYLCFDVGLDIAVGMREGRLRLIFPEPAQPAPVDEAPAKPVASDQMMLVPAQMDLRLKAVPISLARAQALRPGDLVRLSAQSLQEAELIAANGHRVSTGVLGQMNGQRALRLTLPAGAGGAAAFDPADPGVAAMAPGATPALAGAFAMSPGAVSDLPDTDLSAGGLDDLPDLPPLDAVEPVPLALDDLPDLPPLDFD